MGILLALIAGAGSIGNFMSLQNTPLQVILTVLSLIAMVVYRGRRSRASYQHDGTRIFTLGFSICFIAFLGSAAILLAFVMHLN